jgi:HEAT repeat protein
MGPISLHRFRKRLNEVISAFEGDPDLFSRLLEAVEMSDRPFLEYEAVEGPLLEALVSEPDPKIRVAVARQLLRLGPPRTVASITAFQRAAEDSDPEVGRAARGCLVACCLQGTPLAALALSLIGDEQPEVRAAEAALRSLPPDELSQASGVVSALVSMIRDPQPEVRTAAIEGLQTTTPDTACVAVPALMRALEDPDASVRCAAISTLQWLGTEAIRAVPVLVNIVLCGSERVVCVSAVRALGVIDPGYVLTSPRLEVIKGEGARDRLVKLLSAAGPETRSLRQALSTRWVKEEPIDTWEGAAHPDGPETLEHKVWWGGRCARLAPQPFALLCYMWKKDMAAEEVVGNHVWKDGSWNTEKLKVALNKVKEALEEVGAPWRYGQKHRQIVKRLLSEEP